MIVNREIISGSTPPGFGAADKAARSEPKFLATCKPLLSYHRAGKLGRHLSRVQVHDRNNEYFHMAGTKRAPASIYPWKFDIPGWL